jgi:hypothetical protein
MADVSDEAEVAGGVEESEPEAEAETGSAVVADTAAAGWGEWRATKSRVAPSTAPTTTPASAADARRADRAGSRGVARGVSTETLEGCDT